MDEKDQLHLTTMKLNELITETTIRAELSLVCDRSMEYRTGQLNCDIEALLLYASSGPSDIHEGYFQQEMPAVNDAAEYEYCKGYANEYQVLLKEFRTKFGFPTD